MTKRIFTTDGHTEDLPGGAQRVYRAGEYYQIDDEDAEPLIDERKAYDEDNPPTCKYCGESFTGEDAYLLLDGHIDEEHPDDAWDDADATEAAAGLGREHEISPQSVVGTGEDGRILKSDVEAHIEE